MLEDYNILILGGDSRYLYLITNLANKNAYLSVIGFNEYTFSHSNIKHESINDVDFSVFDAIVLPVTGTSETGEIVPTYDKQPFLLTANQIKQTKKHCVIFTGIKNKFLEQITERTNRELIALFNRDDIAILNSIPTAEATLKLAIEHTDYMMHGANIFILGFGRVGFTTARLFHNIGANVTVAIRSSADFARIREMNMTPLHIDDLQDNLANAQIVINTIPHLVLTRDLLKVMNKDSLIIDLASTPGGTNFSAAKDYDIQALHALGLPGKTAPKTASNVLSDTIIHLLPNLNE